MTNEELMETQLKITAFYKHLRHSPNWSLRDQFIELNSILGIKRTLKYLLFGEGNYKKRMVNCIFNQEYRL